jgi:hypothetical protein
MAKVKIQGHASGTGILTVTAPNTSTDRTITLPDADVTLGAATPSISDGGNATAITIDSSESVGIDNSTGFGTYSGTGVKYSKGDGTFFIGRDGGGALLINRETDQGDMIALNVAGSSKVKIGTVSDGLFLGTGTGGNTKRLTITSDGLGVSQFTANAWCAFNATGTPAIRDSYNVSSIGDNGTGWFYVNIDVNLANANSACVGSGSNANNTYRILIDTAVQVTTAVYVMCSGHSTSSSVAATDPEFVNVIVFGD